MRVKVGRLCSSPTKFMTRVQKDKTTGCWVWCGRRTHEQYGSIKIGGGKSTMAHRISYEMFVGPIPAGLVIDHLCRNPSCVNPAHLEVVTNRENSIVRGIGGMADKARKTHCSRGHLLSGANVIREGKYQTRRCVTCAKTRHYREKQQRQQSARQQQA